MDIAADASAQGKAVLRALGVGLATWALSTFVASPALFAWRWGGIMENSRAADFLRLCADPLARDLGEPVMAYRIAVPVIAWLLRLSPLVALILPYVAHVGFLAVSYFALRQRTDARVGWWGTCILALSFALFWSNWRPGFTDTTTHLMAAVLLLTFSPPWVMAATFLGLLNDERMVLALPFVTLWHFPLHRIAALGAAAIRFAVGVAAGLGAYLLVRLALTHGWVGEAVGEIPTYDGMGTNVLNFTPHLGSWAVWALNVFLSFRWAWALVPAGLWLLVRQGRRADAAALAFFLGVGALASSVVADVARSVAFMFTAWLLVILQLHEEAAERLGGRLRMIVVAMLLTPVFFTFENFSIHWFRPLPLVLLRMLTGWDPVQLWR